MSADNVAEKKTRHNTCFARRHMPPAVFAFYSYACAVSEDSGIFYSDDRRDAKEFGQNGVSNHTIFVLRRFLEREHWFIRKNKGRARKRNPRTGTYDSIQYRVVDHDDWAADHPGHCRFIPPDAKTASSPDAESTASSLSPDANSAFTRRNLGDHLTQFSLSPDANSAAKTEKKDRRERQKGETEAQRLKTGAGVPDFPIDSYQITHLRNEAREHGWSKAEFDELLQTEFHVSLAKQLTFAQYRFALRIIEEALPLPPGLRHAKSR